MGSLHNIGFRCVLRFREGTGFREPVPGAECGSRSRWVPTGSGVLTGSVSESGCGFEGFGVPGFDGFLMGSDGFEGFGDFGFDGVPKGSGSKSCRRHVGPSSCHLGVGAMRLAMLCGE